MPEPIPVAVFGNGFGRSVVLPCLRRVEGIRLAGLASPNLERARATAAEFGIERVAADHREILERARPGLVFVATPPHRHKEMAIDALRAGCHVVCEKPTALSGEESAEMLAEARRAPGRLALIDHELRFLPARAAMREMIAAGRLGAIRRASFLLHSPGRRDPSLPWTWWSDLAQGGGALGAIGSHAVDALRVLLDDEVAEARGILRTFVGERVDPATARPRGVTSDDYAAAWLRFRGGAAADLTISMVEHDRVHRISLAGSEGAAVSDEQRPLRASVRSGPWTDLPDTDPTPPSAALGIPDTDWARAFLLFARRVAQAIRAGRGDVPGAATFEDGHRNQLVLDAIRRSAARGDWVAVGGAD